MTEQHQTVAEIAELAGGLAHELRNPLSTMMVNLKLLAEDLQAPSTRLEDVRRRALIRLETVRREAERLQQLFDDFLNLAGPCKLRREPTDLNAVVARLVNFYDPVARGQGIEIQFRPSGNAVVACVDDKLLSQALLNIVINAQQAMPSGGILQVSTRSEGDHALIDVSDTGVGISPADFDRILRPFFSTKPGGSGLGLSITQRIVAEHGGTLTFRSELGRGTTFVIQLPIAP